MFKRFALCIALTIPAIYAADIPAERPEPQGITFLKYYQANKDRVDTSIITKNGQLHINGLNLTDLEGIDTLPNIDQITFIDASNNLLTTLPEGLLKFKNLKIFSLYNNKFTKIPELVCELTKLTSLDMGFNRVTDLPSCLSDLADLEFLSLSGNDIESIPEWICGFEKLNVLGLIENKISELPDCIGELTSLTRLDLARNKIKHVPNLSALKELRWVNLYDNPIGIGPNQLRKEMGLSDQTHLNYKSQETYEREQALLSAIVEGNVAAVKHQFDQSYGDYFYGLQDAYGDNLLHAVIRAASDQLRQVRKQINAVRKSKLPVAEESKVIKSLEEQIDDINDRYMKIFRIFLDIDPDILGIMLQAPNDQGQNVIEAMFAKLGPDNPMFIAVEEAILGIKRKEAAKQTPEKKAQPVAAPKAPQTKEAAAAREKAEFEKALRDIAEYERTFKQQEEKKSKEPAVKVQGQEAAVMRKNTLSNLYELQEIVEKNNMKSLSTQFRSIVSLVETQPYTSDVLQLAIDMLKSLGTARVRYEGQRIAFSKLAEPVITGMNRDIKALGG